MILIAIIVYTIFFFAAVIFNGYLEAIQFNEFYRIVIVLLFFSLDCVFCAPIINKTNIWDIWNLKKGAKIYKFTYIALWILILLTFPLIVIIPLEIVLFIWTLLFTIYILIKIIIYRKNYEKPLEKIITMFRKIDFAIALIILLLMMGFQLFKGIKPLYEYNKTTKAYFVGYEEVKTNNVYIKNYPRFSYKVNGIEYISTTKYPVFFKIYDARNEKEIKIMYKENNPNYYVFIKNQAIWNIIGGSFSFLFIICFTTFYIKFRNIEEN